MQGIAQQTPDAALCKPVQVTLSDIGSVVLEQTVVQSSMQACSAVGSTGAGGAQDGRQPESARAVRCEQGWPPRVEA